MGRILVVAVIVLGATASASGPGVRGAQAAAVPPGSVTADTVWTPLSDADLVRELRAGGFVLACRHALTDHDQRDAEPMSMEDRSAQRNLSAGGVAQARALGAEMRRLRIPVAPVLSSPYFRTRESAELAFGEVQVHAALYGSGKETALEELFRAPTAPGRNRVLMTHQGILRRVLKRFRSGEIAEGDCVVVRPGSEGFTLVAHLSLEDWRRLR